MSDMETIMKFEYLPNEIFLHCFEYLNAIDIFYSFDDLNYRFYKLIRNISLHLNVEHIKHSMVLRFCDKLVLNPEIKTQVMSLKLSNKNSFDFIQVLCSFISLNEFSQLRSLSLIDLDDNDFNQISSQVPLLTNLRYFHCKTSSIETDKILRSLSASTMQTLSVPTLNFDLVFLVPFTSIISFIISDCSMKELFYLFKYSPRLQYLTIDTINNHYSFSKINELRLIEGHAAHLKRLSINDFQIGFDSLEILVQRTPNLKFLMISANYHIEMIDACRWQRLIKTSLPRLDIFKFGFQVELENYANDISDRFQQFQTEFWHEQHHWYTEWALDKDRVFIYTTPCILDNCMVTSHTRRHWNASINNSMAFKNITDLRLFIEAIRDPFQYHFPNVKSLRLDNDYEYKIHDYPPLRNKHIHCLKSIVNIYNLTHLDILSKCRIESPLVFLHLLEEAPHISSLKIGKSTLFSLFKNDELCKYFNNVITKLDITSSDNFLDSGEIVKICEIFTNMEQFRCCTRKADNLLLILNELLKLSHMKRFYYKTSDNGCGDQWLKNHASELDFCSFTIECAGIIW